MTAVEQMGLASPLLDYALYFVGTKSPNAEIVVRLRDYQTPTSSILIARGFEEVQRDTLFIKHGRVQMAERPMGSY